MKQYRNQEELDKEVRQRLQTEKPQVKERYEKLRSLVVQKYPDKRTKTYQHRIKRLERREHKMSEQWYTFKSLELKRILASDDYQSYLRERQEMKSQIKVMNIERVKEQLKSQNVPLDRLVFLAHDRIDRFAEYFDSVPFCHVFGHRHGYTSSYRTKYRQPNTGRTNYINISSLDKHYPKNCDYSLPPNYVVMHFDGNKRIASEAVYLDMCQFPLPTDKEKRRSAISELFDLVTYYELELGVDGEEYLEWVKEQEKLITTF